MSKRGGTAKAEGVEAAAVEAAEANAEWWTSEWLKFPTVSLDDEGRWRYWDVPTDTGVYNDDWRVGEGLARDTVAQMQRFMAGSSALRRILREIDFDSTVGQGFITRVEDMLSNPDLYLESLEPGSVRGKLRALAARDQTPGQG
ncbi:MAG: hypothetical protein QNJ67_22790 [Kiloniellales bacterium]|nr:hypothetical protein [Kiloniellales bacterium]